jgi:hypothetical protein
MTLSVGPDAIAAILFAENERVWQDAELKPSAKVDLRESERQCVDEISKMFNG